MAAVALATCRRARNLLISGAGYIAGESPGLVTVNAVPSGRFVIVQMRSTAQVVATVFSNSDGTYRINGLDPDRQFDVIARDWSNTYNDVIVSRVNPQPY